MPISKIIVLTGEENSGKSTLINKVVDEILAQGTHDYINLIGTKAGRKLNQNAGVIDKFGILVPIKSDCKIIDRNKLFEDSKSPEIANEDKFIGILGDGDSWKGEVEACIDLFSKVNAPITVLCASRDDINNPDNVLVALKQKYQNIVTDVRNLISSSSIVSMIC